MGGNFLKTINKKSRYFVAIILLALGKTICGLYPPQIAWAQADQSTAAEELYDSGIVHYEAGRYEEEIADFDEALLLDSGLVNSLYLRGWSKWQLGKSPEAIEDFNKTIELRPFDPQPYFLRGYAKVSLDLFEEAIADYDESLRLNPNQPNVFHRRGVALAAVARYAEAVADFDQALSLDSTLHVIYSLRGESQHKREQYTEALANYDQSILKFPEGALNIHRRGLARYALEQYEGAAEDFAKSQQLGGLGYRDLQFQDEVKIGLYEPTLTSLFNSRRSELFTAVKMGDLTAVQRVIEAGIPIGVMIGYNFHSPLHAAAWEGHADITGALLEGEANPSFSDWDGQTPLFLVAGGSGEVGVITELLDFGAPPNIRNEKGEMPLHVAAFKGHVAAAKALLDGEAEVDAKTTDAVSGGGLTPLHLAAAQGHKLLVELLLTHDADPQAPDDYSRNAPL